MFSFLTSLDNLYAAWYEFRCGKRDRPDVLAFERHLEDNIFGLHEELVSGTYRHGSYHKFHVFDPKHRVIHKATVRDRLVHHAVHRLLLPVFEQSFIFDSYSCRDEKGAHAAVRRLEVFARRVSKKYRGSCWALKFDVRKFFDSVDHEILLDILRKRIPDERVMNLVTNIVESYSAPEPIGGGVGFERPKTWVTDWEPNLATFCQCIYGCI